MARLLVGLLALTLNLSGRGTSNILVFSPQEGRAVIDAGNVARLHSAQQIDFVNLPAEAGEVRSGWFAANASASRFLIRTKTETLLLLDEDSQLLDSYFIPGSDGLPTTIMDAALEDTMASLHSDGAGYVVAERVGDALWAAPIDEAHIPLSVWIGEHIWLETLPQTPETPEVLLGYTQGEFVREHLNPAENDPDSIIRIGRILPPQAVTVTETGLVKLWNMETGELVRSADVDGLPQFGAVNTAGTHFAWRGGDSYAINLLNFETGENRIIDPDAPLVDWLFVGASGDVVLGVGYDGLPHVVAWNVATGEMTDLGEYRACNRPPDTVRLSRDGTTLIIGCDTGLDLWRVEGTP
jgi:hypothetical protein